MRERDGNLCNGASACDGAGQCTEGSPHVFNDGNPRTIDSCDPLTGVRHEPVFVGSTCSDGNACNGDKMCDAAGQ